MCCVHRCAGKSVILLSVFVRVHLLIKLIRGDIFMSYCMVGHTHPWITEGAWTQHDFWILTFNLCRRWVQVKPQVKADDTWPWNQIIFSLIGLSLDSLPDVFLMADDQLLIKVSRLWSLMLGNVLQTISFTFNFSLRVCFSTKLHWNYIESVWIWLSTVGGCLLQMILCGAANVVRFDTCAACHVENTLGLLHFLFGW